MIKVLQDWNEIGAATTFLKQREYPSHGQPEKNWDFAELQHALAALPPDAPIVDLGCGDLYTLNYLTRLGFRKLSGIDLLMPVRLRVKQLVRAYRLRRIPFHLTRGDLTHTPYADEQFEGAVSLSVVEHGVDAAPFFREAARILKVGGILFLTTDYWRDLDIGTPRDARPFGQAWNPFDERKVEAWIHAAKQHALGLVKPEPGIPPCRDRCVVWNGCAYTFICLVFRKNALPTSAHQSASGRAQP